MNFPVDRTTQKSAISFSCNYLVAFELSANVSQWLLYNQVASLINPLYRCYFHSDTDRFERD